MGIARKKYYDDTYGEKKIELVKIGTHPEYRNRGVATKLIRWGLELANEQEKAVAVVGNSTGSKLYKSLGFKIMGTVLVQMEGEEEKMELSAMIFELNGGCRDIEEPRGCEKHNSY
jgi:ribosomal protein S18 acetylase RimI-like enzyme